MSEELKKVSVGVELTDEDLELVNGGAYTDDEWMNMTEEEQIAAQNRSVRARLKGLTCELD